jgi:hypothetical protein
MKKAFYAFLFLILFFFLPFKQSFADQNFSTDYNVTYSVSKNSQTHVDLKGSLKNLSDKYYASSYSIQVGFTDIRNLKVSDSDGAISPKVVRKDNGSLITIEFNRRIVGINNKTNFTVSFDTSEVAKNYNNIWDINIPGISHENDFSSFNVIVSYPPSLGKPTYIKPSLLNDKGNETGKLTFTKTELGDSGISLAFGDFQVYDFNLKYNLENKNLFPISTEIALPPTTNYQDVSIKNMDPKPKNVTIDKDGNWLAQYLLSASKKLAIEVSGKAKVYIAPKEENLTANELNEYLRPAKYWDTENETIKETARRLKTPYGIYQYIIKTLKYDFSRIQTDSPRLGASKALSDPKSAVCLEFTDLFVALARAAGIPAREIDGYAFTNNDNKRPLSFVKDILHAWPEYYDFDKKTWIMVDPTWGNTTNGIDYFNTLDFDHITFVIKGHDSSYPVPAGGYKLTKTQDTKDVNVTIGNDFELPNESLEPKVNLQNPIIGGLPINGFVKIQNTGSVVSQREQIDVETSFLTPKSQTVFVQSIPPFGYKVIPISFNKTPLLTNQKDTIKISLGSKTTHEDLLILPFFINKWFLLGGLLIVSILLIISITAYVYRRVSLSRQKG